MSQTYSALSAAFNSPSVSYKDQEAGVVHEVFFWHYIFSTVEPPYPYALAQLGNSWSASGGIQCKAQLLGERFTFDENKT